MENIIWVVLLCAVLALLFAAWKTSVVSKADAGTERMKEIAGNISDGARAFLFAEYKILVIFVAVLFVLIGLFITFFVVFCCIYFHRHILSPAFRQLEEDRRESRRRMDELQMERQQMQTELSRLADVCRNESVPDAFQTFVAGIPTLTKTEHRIFDGYAAGLRSREIVEQLDIKDSTLRFHNKNIYEKLGVSSLKQLQQFVAILNSGSGSAPDSAPDEK